MSDPDCLFCKIVAGEIPATVVREDERTIAFMDINPATRGHVLVVPRAHARDQLQGVRGTAARARSSGGAHSVPARYPPRCAAPIAPYMPYDPPMSCRIAGSSSP